MDPVLVEVAEGAAAVLAPFLAGAAGGAAGRLEELGGEAGASVVGRLWARLRALPRVARAGEEPDDGYRGEDLAREIARALATDGALLDEVVDLLARAQSAGAPVEGHALVERVRAGRHVLAEGSAATVRDVDAGWDVVARARPGPPPPGGADPGPRPARPPGAEGRAAPGPGGPVPKP